MSIIAHGIDLVDMDGFKLTANDPDAMLSCFTSSELKEIGDDSRKLAKAAGRFAVKEAVLKALGEGWGEDIALTDVEVWNDPKGAPNVRLHGRVDELAKEQGITQWLVSTSHDGQYAIASVIALSSKT